MVRRLIGLSAVSIILVSTLQGFPAAASAQPDAPVAAAALPVRADSLSRPLYLVHGLEHDASGYDCRTYWGQTLTELPRQGWLGPVITWGYYQGDTNCTYKFNGNVNTGVKEVARQFAWEIYNRHSQHNRSVDVVGHSMGGLVIRAALTGVSKKESGFPPYLYVEDATTIATPHTGSTNTGTCRQCQDIRAGSEFFNWLQHSPQSTITTDWSLIGSADDELVNKDSSLGMNNVRHKVWYPAGQGLSHGAINKKALGTYRQEYWNAGQSAWGTDSTMAPGIAAKRASRFCTKW